MSKFRVLLIRGPQLVFATMLAFSVANAQSSSERSARETVERLSRIDTNRAADLQVIRGNQDNALRRAILKQINDDFRDLQSVNNKMMADAWSQTALDYTHVSKTLGEIQKKANRLKSNLVLPRSTEEEKDESKSQISTEKEFRVELLTLDRFVMRFVRNPIFRSTNVIELESASQANRDLEQIIKLCNRLKKVSSQLRKTLKTK